MIRIAGVYHLDGRLVEQELVRAISMAGGYGARSAYVWVSDNVGMVGTTSRLYPASSGACSVQPQNSPGAAAFHITLDGIITNSHELVEALKSCDVCLDASATHSEIVLWSYLTWGVECLQRIVGDFAFAIWDPTQRWVFCARDRIGLRQLFYFFDGQTFFWASEIRQILATRWVQFPINKAYIGQYLMSRVRHLSNTQVS